MQLEASSMYKGKMLRAMGVDGNNQLFPLSFAIVEEESFDSWRWFLSCLREKVTQRQGICLISDRHKGITAAVNDPYSMWQEPWGYHRYCLRHICSNFNDKFHNKQLKMLVYRAGSAHQVRKFDDIMKEIDKTNPDARKWLDKIHPPQWSLAHDGGRRYGIMTTNLSEVFNSVLKGARNLPITACVQLTFYRLVKFFCVRRGFVGDALAKQYLYTPHVLANIEGYRVKANTHDIVLFDRAQGVCEVVTAPYGEGMQKGHNKQVVHLYEKTCSCGKWQIYKFSCSHAMTVCGQLGLDIWQYIEEYYTIQHYTQTWVSQFSPIPHEDYWPKENIPPLLQILLAGVQKKDDHNPHELETRWISKKVKLKHGVAFVKRRVMISGHVKRRERRWTDIQICSRW
ncbi:unnamed protein product [Cuscuta europaea]|uniref:SWIM-type domain-containing protein n=1 Tax=Cuscuta europaea TaxID=41803 RepID=A0A9P1E2Q6_CUSEU|nr:unnamed protein product [Cuscuta europaea]